MIERNNGIGESNVLQNQFTAYLMTAIKRRKISYQMKKSKQLQSEISLDAENQLLPISNESDLLGNFSLLDQIESSQLQRALSQLKERDLQILLMKVLEEQSFSEIADTVGLGYKGTAAVYYRLIQKLKKELRGDDE